LFIDNPRWHPQRNPLTYGMFVGGLQLGEGVQTPPNLSEVTVNPGQGRNHTMVLTPLRKLTTRVSKFQPVTPAGNGQGQLVLGVFQTDDPRSDIAIGGARPGCINANNYPWAPSDAAAWPDGYEVNAFFFSNGAGSYYVGGQVDDYNIGANPSSGALVSVIRNDAGVERLPPSQRFSVTATQYAVTVPRVLLTAVLPGAPPTDTYSCPTPDGGS
jgi:hypothetical protein